MSTARAQLRAGVKTVIDAIQTANPTLLAHTYDHRPPKFLTPCGFVENQIRTVTVQHDASTRLRTLQAEAHFVNKPITNEQVSHEQDVLSDLAEDAFTAAPRVTSAQTLTEYVGVDGHTEVDGSVSYECTVVTVQVRVQEGRL